MHDGHADLRIPTSNQLKQLAGAEGIEPSHDGIKIRCLTAWLRPKAREPRSATLYAARTIIAAGPKGKVPTSGTGISSRQVPGTTNPPRIYDGRRVSETE